MTQQQRHSQLPTSRSVARFWPSQTRTFAFKAQRIVSTIPQIRESIHNNKHNSLQVAPTTKQLWNPQNISTTHRHEFWRFQTMSFLRWCVLLRILMRWAMYSGYYGHGGALAGAESVRLNQLEYKWCLTQARQKATHHTGPLFHLHSLPRAHGDEFWRLLQDWWVLQMSFRLTSALVFKERGPETHNVGQLCTFSQPLVFSPVLRNMPISSTTTLGRMS